MSRSDRTLRRLLHPLYRKLETVVHPLRYLFIEVTQRCNLECRHCGSDCTRDAQVDELSTTEWLDFFSYLATHFEPDSLVLIITGGEPFCHPELDRLLFGLREHRLRFGMVTNGWALTANNVDTIVRHGIYTITVSLDGLEGTHDWLRGKKGSFKRAVAGIERLVAARLPLFDVVTCVHPRNIDELPAVSALLQKLGVPAWRLFAIFPKGRAKTDGGLTLDPSDWRRLLDFIAAERRACDPQRFSINFSCEAHLPAAVDRAVRDEPYFCRAGIAIGSVLCDGSISACPNITRTLVQGNIRTDDFATVWEKRFQPFRDRRWMRRGECVSCGQWSRCQGNSLHLWDAEAQRPSFCAYRVLAGSPHEAPASAPGSSGPLSA